MKRSMLRDRGVNALIRTVLGVAMLVPYRLRVPAMGWIVSRLVAPVAGWRKRIRANLAHVCPEMAPKEIERLVRAVPDNAGRTLIEIYSGEGFRRRARATPLSGPGLAPLRTAHREGRPVIMVTGHFGNYDVPRVALAAEGIALGSLYREMRNPYFNTHYVEAMRGNAEPVFPATRRGLLGFVAHLKRGGAVGILIDVFAGHGAPVTFFGKTAPTATSVAEWALKFDALVVPVYGIRKANGIDFEILLDDPVPLTDPITLTQALNDSLERVCRGHMEQWFWIHRRWKPELRASENPAGGRESSAR